jgi:GntR family transcriptional regulator
MGWWGVGSNTLKDSAFRRVAEDLRAQILHQAFPAGSPLPTEAALERQYGVSRQTVRRAFQDLVAEGLVFRMPGRGTFTIPPSERYLRQFGSVEDLMALSADSEMCILHPLAEMVNPGSAGRLRLADDQVATTSFLRLHHGRPFCHTLVFLPPHLGSELKTADELMTKGAISRVTVIGLLDKVLAAPIREVEQSISIAVAPPEVATSLGLPAKASLLRIERTYFDSHSEPVELAISHFHPDRYSYRVRLRRHVG